MNLKGREKAKNKSMAIFYALLADALYAINIPLSKKMKNIQPIMMASFLYIGDGIGLFCIVILK